ncbi:MAG: HAD family hydrolase [Candidatus Thorarchaeota archaeon]
MSNYRAVVFDMDGTLTDTMQLIPKLLAEELRIDSQGIQYRSFQNWLAQYYYQNHSWMNKKLPFHLAKAFNHTLFGILLVFGRIGVRYVKDLENHRIFPGTLDVLSSIKSFGLELGLATNGREFEVKKKLPLEVRKMFKVLITKKRGIAKKPRPDLILLSAKRLGVSPSEIIYIGDTLADMLASKAAGCEFILVSTGAFGLDTVQFNGNLPKYTVNDLRDIPPLIEGLLRAN